MEIVESWKSRVESRKSGVKSLESKVSSRESGVETHKSRHLFHASPALGAAINRYTSYVVGYWFVVDGWIVSFQPSAKRAQGSGSRDQPSPKAPTSQRGDSNTGIRATFVVAGSWLMVAGSPPPAPPEDGDL